MPQGEEDMRDNHHSRATAGRQRRRIIALVAAAVLTTGASVALAPSAFAALLATSTSVSASPANSTAGTSVTLTATVGITGLGGAGITPTGSVSFSANGVGTTTQLGSAALNSCVLSSCTATLKTTAIPWGSTSVTASYPGDGVVGPSSGSTPVSVTQPVPQPTGTSTSRTCPAGVDCETGYVNTTSTGLDTDSQPSSSQQTVTESLDTSGKNLHCHQNTDAQVGNLGTFDTTATDSSKTVHYLGKGNVATKMLSYYGQHPAYLGCFGSPHPFNGYIGGTYQAAQTVSEQGEVLYEAQLANCATHAALPCFTLTQNVNGTVTMNVSAPSGDPKVIV
jgi:hypothetical protein